MEKSEFVAILSEVYNQNKRSFYEEDTSSIEGVISYLRNNSFCYNLSNKPGFIIDDKNKELTIGKYIRRNLRYPKNYLSDKSLDIFVCSIINKLSSSENVNIEFLKGKDIVNFYEQSEFYSCMTGNSAYKTELYALNQDVVCLVVLNNIARALLWTCIDGTKVLDRIYPAGSKNVSILSGWAKNNGILTRQLLDKPEYNTIKLVDNSTRFVSLSINEEQPYPYLDTFRYGHFNSNKKNLLLSNNSSFGDISFCEISGHYHIMKPCFHCMKKDIVNNLFFVSEKYFCAKCVKICCKMCCHCDRYVLANDIKIYKDCYNTCYYYCQYCFNKNFDKCSICNKLNSVADLLYYGKLLGIKRCKLCAMNA